MGKNFKILLTLFLISVIAVTIYIYEHKKRQRIEILERISQ